MHEQPVLSLSTISHELRNPLTLIHSTLQLIGRHHPEVVEDPLWPQLLLDINYMSQLLSDSELFPDKYSTIFDKYRILLFFLRTNPK